MVVIIKIAYSIGANAILTLWEAMVLGLTSGYMPNTHSL